MTTISFNQFSTTYNYTISIRTWLDTFFERRQYSVGHAISIELCTLHRKFENAFFFLSCYTIIIFHLQQATINIKHESEDIVCSIFFGIFRRHCSAFRNVPNIMYCIEKNPRGRTVLLSTIGNNVRLVRGCGIIVTGKCDRTSAVVRGCGVCLFSISS